MKTNNYTSTCDTANGTMLFDFSDGFAVYLDQRREVAKKLRNGEVMEQFSTAGMKIEEFARILINFGVGLLPRDTIARERGEIGPIKTFNTHK